MRHHVHTPILLAGAALATGATGLQRRFSALCAALGAAFAVALAAAFPAAAQQAGNPDQVENALQAAVDWISGIVVTVGVLGLIAASIVWIFSGSNERRREKATSWVVGCVGAIAVAFLAPSIVALLQQWTGGGG